MTVTSDVDHLEASDGHQVFISYRRESSGEAARALADELKNLARNHDEARSMRIFLDRDSLRMGPLREDIRRGLATSDALIVLLDSQTVESPWVDEEVRTWLDGYGTPERLFLVRTDSALNLGWDADACDFQEPERLPPALRGVYDDEQLWLDYRAKPARRRRLPDGEVAALCAAILGIKPDELLLAEIRHQRARRRRSTIMAGVVGALAVVAAVAGYAATRSRDAAVAARKSAEAEANVSEALLVADADPLRAIPLIVDAATQQHTPSVRAGMLYVLQRSIALEQAITETQAFERIADIALDERTATSRLLVNGPDASSDGWRFQIWNLDRRKLETDVVVDVQDPGAVAWDGQGVIATCSSSTFRLLRVARGRISVTQETELETRLADGACIPRPFGNGWIAIGNGQHSETPVVVHVASDGDVHEFAELTTFGIDAAGATAVVGSRDRSFVVADDRVHAAADVVQSVRQLTGDGVAIVQLADGRWARTDVRGGALKQSLLDVPAGASDVAAVLDLGRRTDDVVWIDGGGTLHSSRGAAVAVVTDHAGEIGWRQFRPTLLPLGDNVFGVVYGTSLNIATLGDEIGRGDGWRVEPVDLTMGQPDTSDTRPRVARCDGESVVLITTSAAKLLVDRRGAVTIDGESAPYLAPTCVAITLDGDMKVYRSSDAPPERLRAHRRVDAFSIGERRVAVLDGGAIEVYRHGTERVAPWTYVPTAPIVFGGWRDSTTAGVDGERLVVTSHSGERWSSDLGFMADVVVLAPDGRAAVVRQIGGDGRLFLVTPEKRLEVNDWCSERARFVPSTRNPASAQDLREHILVDSVGDFDVVGCLTGDSVPVVAPTPSDVIAYEIGEDRAMVVLRGGDGSLVATTADADTGVVSVTLDDSVVGASATDSPGVIATWTAAGTVAVVSTAEGAANPAFSVASGLRDVSKATLVAGGTLLVVVSVDGGFEVYDIATHRLLAFDRESHTIGESGDSDVAVQEVDDEVHLFAEGQVVRVPVGFDRLVRAVCARMAVSGCPPT